MPTEAEWEVKNAVLSIDFEDAEESVGYNIEMLDSFGAWRPYASNMQQDWAHKDVDKYKRERPNCTFRVEPKEIRDERVEIMAYLLAKDRVEKESRKNNAGMDEIRSPLDATLAKAREGAWK